MLKRFFGERIHDQLHLLGVSVLCIGIPLNKVVMSISMLFLVLNLLLEKEFKTYTNNLKKNKLFLLILFFFGLHIISFLWSSNTSYALHDLKVKLPLLIIGIVLSAKPITNQERLKFILNCFLSSLTFTSLINYLSYTGIIFQFEYDDIRGMSLFTSHVRFGLLISFGVAVVFYNLHLYKKHRLIFTAIAIWFCYYTYYSQVLSGVITLLGIIFITLFLIIWKHNKLIASLFSIITTSVTIWFVFWLLTPVTLDAKQYENLPELTVEGNPYSHCLDYIDPETKGPIQAFISKVEIEREWLKKSQISIDSFDVKKQPIEQTLIRYLTASGYRKDAQGVRKLSLEDVKNIENGHTSPNFNGVLARIYSVQYQISNNGDPNGHSLLERLEYWQNGWTIAKNNFWLGVGAGDVQDAFNKQYVNSKSKLKTENRNRAHNSYLTTFITFGIIGLIYFLYFHLYFIRQSIVTKNYLGILFIITILLSYLTEDTLETQTGITFFAFFLFLTPLLNQGLMLSKTK